MLTDPMTPFPKNQDKWVKAIEKLSKKIAALEKPIVNIPLTVGEYYTKHLEK